MNETTSDILAHYGTKYHSGRYPWGSGEEPYQHSGDFMSRVDELKSKGLSEKEIADAMKMSTTDLRMQVRVANHQRRALLAERARSLREDGKTLQEIAEIMGYSNDSSVRQLLNASISENKNKANNTADILRKALENKNSGMIDVGAGVERELGVTRNTLEEALFIMRTEGANVYGVGMPQVTDPRRQTNIEVLAREDISYGDAYKRRGEIDSLIEYHSTDSGETFDVLKPPSSIDSSRIFIRYAEDGGLARDGTIELRRGVPDLDMGDSHYAQVRILADGTHYMKGMAFYSDDIPDGYDIVFNTNKPAGTPMMGSKDSTVLKPIKTEDPNNPFGALIKANGQRMYTDIDGEQKLSPINKLKEEGDWDDMSRNLSQQFLSKQPIKLIRERLDATIQDTLDEYHDIQSLDNPTIRKKYLLDFAEECDANAVFMKASALPRQRTQVILPVDSLSPNEIFAPNYENGEQVALIRFPHGGTFEIPVLKVNNNSKAGNDIVGPNARDAVGINSKVAERLSGADFDGDTVVVIPMKSAKINSTKPLEGLIGFDAKTEYAIPPGNPNNVPLMKKSMVQKQMGMISNLITDMTLQGANTDELARAVRHSQVVIDAEKHKLNYTQSERDNGIQELREKYQHRVVDGEDKYGGASTLLSRRKQEVEVPERKGSGRINPETGEVEYKESGREYEVLKTDKATGKKVGTGQKKAATDKVPLLLTVKDAHELSSGTIQEDAYADFSNQLRAIANEARKEYVATPGLKYSPEAKAQYASEVSSLTHKLQLAEKNAPRERKAQIVANSYVKAVTDENPQMDKKDIKKLRQRAITEARSKVGASGKDTRISITDDEWKAIQAGAITDTTLTSIMRYADADKLRDRAMPKNDGAISDVKQQKIARMRKSGYSNEEIAKAAGVSVSTVIKYGTGADKKS